MLYENGKWALAPDPDFPQDYGQPVEQIIAKRKAAGQCDKKPPTTTTTTSTPSPTPTTTSQLPAHGAVVFPGTRYALPGAYSPYAPAQERPNKLDFEYKYHSLRNLEWSSWGPKGAQGTGAEWVQTSCDPNCASGPSYSNPVQIRASNPQPPPPDTLCPADVLFYTDVVISYPSTVPPHDRASGAFAVPDLQWTTDDGTTAAHYSARKPFCRA